MSQFGEKAAAMAEERAGSWSCGVQCRTAVSVGSLAWLLVWLLANRRLRIRYERRADILAAFLHLGCALSCAGKLQPL